MRSPRRANPAMPAAIAYVVASESERRCNMTADDVRGSGPGVPPLDAGRDAAHHLVADRPEPIGPLRCPDRLAALRTDQNGLVVDRNRVITAVHHQLIHGDDTDDRPPAA